MIAACAVADSIYTESLAAEICTRLANGESLNAICRDAHMPCRQAVHEWIVDNRQGFGDKYARAREVQIDRLAEETIDIADGVLNKPNVENAEVQAARLAADSRKWFASKLLPKKYGDRLEHVGAGGSPLIPARTDDPDRIAQAVILMLQAPAARLAHTRVIGHSKPEDGDGADE